MPAFAGLLLNDEQATGNSTTAINVRLAVRAAPWRYSRGKAMSHSATWPAQPVETVGFSTRLLAYLVDALLLSFVGGAFPYLVISTVTNNPPVNGAGVGQQATTSGGGSIVVSLIYFVVFWSWLGGGRTLGMRLLHIKVVGASDMAPLGLATAVVRWIGLWLSFALCFIGVIWVGIDSRHQGWHDKLARTLVIRT